MRDLRPEQRALKRLAALPGEENRVGFTNMIKVCGSYQAHPMMTAWTRNI